MRSRHTAHKKHRPKTPQYIRHPVDLIRSPAMRVLSRAGHKVLMCIESELCKHAGKDNGKLPVTYEDLEHFGVHRLGISAALREVEALGLNQITEHGRGGNAEYRRPNLMRLTYLPIDQDHPATNEWKAITTVEEAEAIAKKARTPKKHFSPPKNVKARPLTTGVETPRFRPPKTGVKGQNFRPPKRGVLSRISSHLVLSREASSESAASAPEPQPVRGIVGHNEGPPPDDDLSLPTFLRRGHPDCPFK
jgi:hypothetical protein